MIMDGGPGIAPQHKSRPRLNARMLVLSLKDGKASVHEAFHFYGPW